MRLGNVDSFARHVNEGAGVEDKSGHCELS